MRETPADLLLWTLACVAVWVLICGAMPPGGV